MLKCAMSNTFYSLGHIPFLDPLSIIESFHSPRGGTSENRFYELGKVAVSTPPFLVSTQTNSIALTPFSYRTTLGTQEYTSPLLAHSSSIVVTFSGKFRIKKRSRAGTVHARELVENLGFPLSVQPHAFPLLEPCASSG